MAKLRIDIWSDIACPWCYIGRRRLELALASFPEQGEVDVVWRSFELDPQAPPVDDKSLIERLAAKYRTSPDGAKAMVDRVARVAREDGIEMRFDLVKPGNTFDAHRLLHYARDNNRQDAMKGRLFRAYFAEGVAMGDREALATLAGDVGLDVDNTRAMLATDRYADAVRADEALASELGIHGVPFFVFGGRLAVSGAQPVDALSAVLARAWNERAQQVQLVAEADACGPAGCD